MNPDYIYKATVIAINGDGTLDLEFDYGFNSFKEETVIFAATSPNGQRVTTPIGTIVQVGKVLPFRTFKPSTLVRAESPNAYNVELLPGLAKKYAYKATVLSVHDGDTFRAKIDTGFKHSVIIDVRMQGINAPELSTGTPGQTAKNFLKNLIEGKSVILENWKQGDGQFDKYGRYLAVCYEIENFVPENQVFSINALMIKKKLAASIPTGSSKPTEIRFTDL